MTAILFVSTVLIWGTTWIAIAIEVGPVPVLVSVFYRFAVAALILLVALIVLTTAVSMIVSSLYPRFRDLAIIWTVFSTVLFYASPVLYPLEKVPGTLRDIIVLNPLSPLLELFRKWVVDPTANVKGVATPGSASPT